MRVVLSGGAGIGLFGGIFVSIRIVIAAISFLGAIVVQTLFSRIVNRIFILTVIPTICRRSIRSTKVGTGESEFYPPPGLLEVKQSESSLSDLAFLVRIRVRISGEYIATGSQHVVSGSDSPHIFALSGIFASFQMKGSILLHHGYLIMIAIGRELSRCRTSNARESWP